MNERANEARINLKRAGKTLISGIKGKLSAMEQSLKSMYKSTPPVVPRGEL